MADDPKDGSGEGQPDGTLDDRVGKLEAGQESLAGKLDHVIGMLSGKGGDGGEPAHDPEGTGGGGIADEIRQQLDARDRKKAADDAASSQRSEIDGLKAKVAELAEKPPAPMPRRVEKIMGWH